MSAPKHAKSLGPDGWMERGKPIPVHRLPRVRCESCGWHGRVYELLAVDEEETLWCPQCGTSGWVYF